MPRIILVKYDVRHKETFMLCIKEYFKIFFPILALKMDFDSVRFMDKELNALFDQEPEILTGTKKSKQKDKKGKQSTEKGKRTDALVLVEIDIGNEKPEWIMIHWEQQSEREVNFEERMFSCFCGIYFKYGRIVFPIAMFTDQAKQWRKPIPNRFELSLLGYSINKYEYQLIRLKDFKSTEFEEKMKTNPLAAAYLPLTNYDKKERPLIKAKSLQKIAELVPESPQRAVLCSLVEMSIKLDKEEQEHFQMILNKNNLYKEVKMIQTIKDVGIEIGREEGREEGIEIGEEREAIKMVLNFLEYKFGEKANQYKESLNELSLEQLETIHRRIIISNEIDKVFEGIFSHIN